MKIHLLSDIHEEARPFKIKEYKTDADVLVLAGDIGRLDGFHRENLYKLLVDAKSIYENVIWILGNHCLYNMDFRESYEIAREMSEEIGITFLENEETTIDGIVFFGATGWTDSNLLLAAKDVKEYLMDFRLITVEGKPFTPEFMFEQNMEFRYHLGNTKANVVITHHVPNKEGIHPRWANNSGNYGFQMVNLEIPKSCELFCFGHTHDSADYWKEGVHFVCNPRGYTEYENGENFDPLKVIEI